MNILLTTKDSSKMTTKPVFVCKLWNDDDDCYENVKFIHVGLNKVNGINVLLIGLDDVTKLRVVMQPSWLVQGWMDGGVCEEMLCDDVASLMRKCANVPRLAKKIWDEALV